MEFKDWMSLLAIIASPLIDAWATMKVELCRQLRREQKNLFKTVLSQRGIATSYKWHNAINPISVICYDRKDILQAREWDYLWKRPVEHVKDWSLPCFTGEWIFRRSFNRIPRVA